MRFSIPRRARLCFAASFLVAMLLVASPADAATFTVNRTATDAVDASVGDGVCATSSPTAAPLRA